MEKNINTLNELLKKTSASGLYESINDLRDKEFSGIPLTEKEKKALSNFEQFRISVLNSISDDEQFHLTYRKFQVLANLTPWTDFLNI
ncbi:MAG: hypothetical protein N3F09_06575 [Bacteroidia bacterium]|nr:hypothetical protein [Bacteroidia bacterium]